MSLMAPVETMEHKAERILREARLTVRRVDPASGLIVAECRGFSGEIYALGYDPGMKMWRCTCKRNYEFRKTCSHLTALWRVVVKPGEVGDD